MKTRLNVTKKDIEAGQRKSSWFCPIALAFKRTKLGRVYGMRVRVFLDGLYSTSGGRKLFALDSKAQKFIKAFDQGKKVKPFVTYMEAVYEN